MSSSEEVELVDAHAGWRLAQVRALLRAYGEEITRDAAVAGVLAAQGFAGEVARLPDEYAPPRGALLLALVDGSPAGCVGVRPWADDVAELKRLFVDRPHRGQSLGFKLVEEAINRARSLGYRTLRLDTLPSMRTAIRLYRAFEFAEIAPYRENPMPGTRFFERALDEER